jgi:hypothetical protein
MLKGMREWRNLVLVVVCMIAMLIFGVNYAFAEETPSAVEKPSLETIQKQPLQELQQTPCVTGKPCLELKTKNHRLIIPCIPGGPCISLPTTTPPVKSKPHSPAGKPDKAEAEIM